MHQKQIKNDEYWDRLKEQLKNEFHSAFDDFLLTEAEITDIVDEYVGSEFKNQWEN
ncbi:hypothetical protein [Haemophilus paracuniculus]|uniref:hypothetical protein n=1 Tax=Haemophilus paracuniculus TaxID=734 RepID=UPI001300ED56|nr:hypothetical protein [Haemophilus paracuniculus]